MSTLPAVIENPGNLSVEGLINLHERIEANGGMTPERAKQLREPFPAKVIGKLPRLICKKCSDSKPRGHCDEHRKSKCAECGNYISTAHIHLDYVGHAAVTDRLLQVDPLWTWEPMAYGEKGEPLMANGGLWIRLTICGVTRPGFGDATNGSAVKEIIGDAIRNAAMRFGVALDLWAKEDLASTSEEQGRDGVNPDAANANSSAEANASSSEGKSRPVVTAAQITRLFAVAKTAGVSEDKARELVKEVAGVESTKAIPKDLYDAVIAAIQGAGA